MLPPFVILLFQVVVMSDSFSTLHFYLHAAPKETREVAQVVIREQSLERWLLEPADQSCELRVSFEQFLGGLEKLPGSFVEWDGSFIWRPQGPGGAWLEGNVYDGQSGVQNVECKVHGTLPEFETLLNLLGWPAQAMVIQWVSEGVYLSVSSALRLVSVSS